MDTKTPPIALTIALSLLFYKLLIIYVIVRSEWTLTGEILEQNMYYEGKKQCQMPFDHRSLMHSTQFNNSILSHLELFLNYKTNIINIIMISKGWLLLWCSIAVFLQQLLGKLLHSLSSRSAFVTDGWSNFIFCITQPESKEWNCCIIRM